LNPKKKLIVVDDHDIVRNVVIGIFGPSGCGKTSFLKHLFHHYRHNEKIAYMKQDILLHPELTIYETLWFYTIMRRKEECHNIHNVLKQMKMTDLSDCRIGETKGLSGGEKKRILIAYHLLDETSQYILMDEPFSGIDPHNTDMIFSLMREKTKHCTIIFTAHQLPFDIHHQLDEEWKFVPSLSDPDQFQLEITQNQDDAFSDVSLDTVSSLTITTANTSSAYNQWKYLFLRDRVLDKRNGLSFFMRWATPIFVVLLQEVFIGSFPKYLKQWEKSNQTFDLFKTIIMHTILLFTVSMIPMHMLNDHFQKRSIIQHEISQGIYRRNAYFFSAILWDQLSLVLISLCVVLVLMPPDNFFLTTFFNVMMEMNFTNMLMWVCSSFPRSSFNTTLILVSTYISVAFIGNMGMLLRSDSMDALQYVSMTHIQSNLFMEELFRYYPERNGVLDFAISCLNIHERIRHAGWIGISIGIWSVLPLFMTLYMCLNNNR
jgi:ABC-type lipoprotein export system ATPase subunit